MSRESTVLLMPPTKLNYSLTGENAARAIERGLAEADWYQCPVPRATMRRLLERRDGPAIRDTLLWFALMLGSGFATYLLWPSWWAVIPYMIYGALYASTSDSRWHESGHGTAFKTDWMNNALYEIASFMVMRESTVWRWSHTRHHSDTIIVGRDPEIAVPRPPTSGELSKLLRSVGLSEIFPAHCDALLWPDDGRGEDLHSRRASFPRSTARPHLPGDLFAVIGLAIYTRSILPLMFVGFPNLTAHGCCPSTASPSTPAWPKMCSITGSTAGRST